MDTTKPVSLSVKKLARVFSFTKYPIWGGLEDVITLHEVKEKLASDDELPSKPKSFPMYDDFHEWDLRDYHVGRIAYLVKNPASDPISVDVGVPSMGSHPVWGIDDGNHRLSAAIVRGDETIMVEFSGEEKEILKFIKRFSKK